MPDEMPLVVDTDVAFDDILALLFLLSHPVVDVRAICVSGTGEVTGPEGAKNAAQLVSFAGKQLPVAYGDSTPLAGAREFPAGWRKSANDLYGLRAGLPKSRRPVRADAPSLLVETVMNAKVPPIVVALAPLTNIARALLDAPAIASRLGGIFIMGGALRVPGNIATAEPSMDNSVAEWNIFIDPRAANVVLGCGAPIYVVPLDATMHAPITPAFIERLGQRRNTATSYFAHALMSGQHEIMASRPFSFWDPLAAAIAIDRSLATFESVSLEVVEEEGPQAGALRIVSGGHQVQVAIGVDAARFEQLFLDTLNQTVS